MMRPVICAWSMLLCGTLPALLGADLTVILDFEAAHAAQLDAAMRIEAQRLLQNAGFLLDWRVVNRFSPEESFARLVVVKLKGRCDVALWWPGEVHASAPLGVTYRVDGRVVPFSEVDCDQVRMALAGVRLPINVVAREQLYGRALGRVLAHELFHVLKRTEKHTKEGVTQKYLSAAQLIDDEID